jgi:prophage regulatory protein
MKSFSRLPQVLKRTGASDTTIWRWEKAGKFPKRRRLGPNIVAWDDDELDAWAKSRPAVLAAPASEKSPA